MKTVAEVVSNMPNFLSQIDATWRLVLNCVHSIAIPFGIKSPLEIMSQLVESTDDSGGIVGDVVV